jgi:hypothetical protein
MYVRIDFYTFLVVIYGSFIDYIDFLQAVPGVFNWKNDHILIAKSGNAKITIPKLSVSNFKRG